MNNALMFSKASDEWSTPQALYDALDAEFHFTADVAASAENRKHANYWGLDHPLAEQRNALVFDWPAVCWLNPPYSKCREFIGKAFEQAQRGSTVVVLVPSRTDTRWWHTHVWDRDAHAPRPGVQVRFLKGRLIFGGAPTSAPFPSVVIVFRPPP